MGGGLGGAGHGGPAACKHEGIAGNRPQAFQRILIHTGKPLPLVFHEGLGHAQGNFFFSFHLGFHRPAVFCDSLVGWSDQKYGLLVQPYNVYGQTKDTSVRTFLSRGNRVSGGPARFRTPRTGAAAAEHPKEGGSERSFPGGRASADLRVYRKSSDEASGPPPRMRKPVMPGGGGGGERGGGAGGRQPPG